MNRLESKADQTAAKPSTGRHSWAARVGRKAPQVDVVPRAKHFTSTAGFNIVSSPKGTGRSSPRASKPGPVRTTIGFEPDASVEFESSRPAHGPSRGGLGSLLRTTPGSASSQSVLSEGGTSTALLRQLFKKAISKASREFFQSFDTAEFSRRATLALDEFGHAMRPEVSKVLVRLSLDQRETCREQLLPLLEFLVDRRVLKPGEIFDGLYYLASKMDDIVMDVPRAPKMIHAIILGASRFGLSSKQLRQLDAVMLNCKPTKSVKERLKGIVREYLASNDMREVVRSYLELKAPHFGHQLIKSAISMAMDRSAREREMVQKLVKYLNERKAVKPREMFQGFEKLVQIMDELCMDVPDAPQQLAETIEKAIRSGALSSEFLQQVHILENDKGFEVVEMVRKRLVESGFDSTDSAQREGATDEGKDPAAGKEKEVKKVEIVSVERETSVDILVNPSFGEPVALFDDKNRGGVAPETTPSDSKKNNDNRPNHNLRVDTIAHKTKAHRAADESKAAAAAAEEEGEKKQPSEPQLKDQADLLQQAKEARPTGASSAPAGAADGAVSLSAESETKTKAAAAADVPEEKGHKNRGGVGVGAGALHGSGGAASANPAALESPSAVGKWVVPQRRKTSLEDFTLESVVGRGSYGKVFLVRHRKLKTYFAMKVLRKQEVVKRDVVDNIQLERKVLETVDHPFLVALRYAFQTPAKLYMVMDYIPGGELFSLLATKHELTAKDTRFYAAELIVALEHLHSLSIIYRDLKPENILLHNDGHIALTDFGFAKTNIDVDGKTRSFCGTVDYMAPEVIQKTGHGQGADWWALGVLLYEMSVGRMPFHGANRKATQYSICNHKLRFPKFFDFDMRLLLQGLLRRNVKKRLGCGPKRAEAIKRHDFFRGINWQVVEKKGLTPPFIPEVKNATDVSNFDPEFTREPVVDSDSEYPPTPGVDRYFSGFSYDEESPYLSKT